MGSSKSRLLFGSVFAAVLALAALSLGAGNFAFPIGPATVNGRDAGTYPNLVLPPCDAGYAYGTVDGGSSLGCVAAGGGGVEAGADGQILQSSGGNEVWNTMTGQCGITAAGVISCDGGVSNILPGTSPQVLMTTTGPTTAWETLSQDCTVGATGAVTCTQVQAGATTFGTQGQMTCASADTTCSWTQASESANIQGANSTWTPQTSTHATNQGGGNAQVVVQAPTGSGTTAYLEVDQGATLEALIGPSDILGGSASIFLNPGTAHPSYAQSTILSTGVSGATYFTANSGTAFLGSTTSNYALAATGSNAFFQPGYNVGVNYATTTPDCGGASGAVCGAKATTNPTGATTSGYAQYADHTSGAWCVMGNGGTTTCLPQ
jgi:hypothetical protein